MILFKQTHMAGGLICGTVLLDGESIGEFRVDVPQWDMLREHDTDDVLLVWNELKYRENADEDES